MLLIFFGSIDEFKYPQFVEIELIKKVILLIDMEVINKNMLIKKFNGYFIKYLLRLGKVFQGRRRGSYFEEIRNYF